MREEDYKKWLVSHKINSAVNYISRIKTLEGYYGDIDILYDSDKCQNLIDIFSPITEDEYRNIKNRHKIPISPDLYKSYKEGTSDYKSRVNKYIEFRNDLKPQSKSNLDNNIVKNHTEITEKIEIQKMNNLSKNIILYGPPGTGKTYNSVNYAVAIIEEKDVAKINAENYHDVLGRYNKYKNNGDIAFNTFHQSYGYEEFIEGIKPIMPEDGEESSEIQYKVESGVFKDFCENRTAPVQYLNNDDIGFNDHPTIWKVSLEKTGDNPTRKYCMENGCIRIGWDSYGENLSEETKFEYGGKNILNAFVNGMQIGDIVVSCFTQSHTDAIGVITGDYEWHNELDHYKRLRKVKWIVKDIKYDITKINNAKMTLSAIYKLNLTDSDIIKILEDNGAEITIPKTTNRVFIIDEINRGNISKIFGELITLIEPSKRIGQEECIMVTLPYSKKKLFGVPDNIYIIGTMNTADRSIAHMDTALRRRFDFVEMLPKPSILKDITIDGLNIESMLTQLNKKITALYDREHTIGHAYFIPLKENPTIKCLVGIFKNNIIPLLQEYFYENYEKIQLVLGDNKKIENEFKFVIKQNNDFNELFGNSNDGFDDTPTYTYEINYPAFDNIKSYEHI